MQHEDRGEAHGRQAAPPVVTHQSYRQDDESINLRALWAVLIRNRWAIVILPALIAMLAYLYSSSLTPVFRASSTLLIEMDRGNIVGLPTIDRLNASETYLQTQFELLKSRELTQEVVERLDLVNHPAFAPDSDEPQFVDWRALFDWRHWVRVLGLEQVIPTVQPADTADAVTSPSVIDRRNRIVATVRNRTTISSRSGTQLVDIRVAMADAELAAEIANALATGYIERQLDSRLATTEQATGWMSRRLNDLKAELDESERRLQAYVREQDLVDMGGVTTFEASELEQLNSRLVEARQAFAQAENQHNQIADVADQDWRRQLTVPVVRSNPLVADFVGAEAEARAKVDRLSQRYGPRHPTMIEALDELNAATETLRGQVEQVVASIEQDYELARANLQSLERSFEDNRDAIRDLQSKEFEFRELEREVETNRTLYTTFLNRLKETSATADLEDASARVVNTALVPDSPFKPQTRRNTLVAGVLALMAAVGLALLRDQFDNRIRSATEVRDKLGVSMIGLLPLQKRRADRRRLARLYHAGNDRAFSEAVRTIRTGVVLSGVDEQQPVTMVTSALPGEGKTTLVGNLGSAMGQMGRVLLLEADMRKPAFRSIYTLGKESKGVADVVAGNASLEEAIHTVGDVDVIPCGVLPPNPLELISSDRFRDLLPTLQARYDRIIIDAPPTQSVSDPIVLSTLTTSVIFVVKADATPAPLVSKGLERLAEVNAPLAGVVLDQVDVRKASRYGYGEKYGASGYYDYYGYGGDDSAYRL
ncbi:UNVERIFIED_CONTAM: polysaccharide biosynthesis tyrosine autokinase [Spiribacter pallidus]